MSVEATDKRAAENATHPRISLAMIKAEIQNEAYMTGDTFISHAVTVHNASKSTNPHTKVLTICMCSLKNGWIVLGKSAPASPENYDQELGEKLAYEDCIRQIWPLLGYQLRDQLHKGE